MFGLFAQTMFTATRIAPAFVPEPQQDLRSALRAGERKSVRPTRYQEQDSGR